MNADAVIVGLGNPGPRYAFTRHNVGFLGLDILAQDFGVSFATNKKLQTLETQVTWKDRKCLLLKPQTFMNLSGQTLQSLYANNNHLREKPLIVWHDEVDIPFGQVRVKMGGGDAGHNGLKSIRSVLGHGDFYRVRMGVGRPVQGSEIELADYVLAPFAKDDQAILMGLIERSLKVTEHLLDGHLNKAQEEAAKT